MKGGETLSVLGSAFLHSESEATPMHNGSLSIFDGEGWRKRSGQLRVRALRAHIESRIAEVPKLRQHPTWPSPGIGRPRWVDDTCFDIERHVRFTDLPTPVSMHRLFTEVERLQMGMLDRAHPLWEMWFIDGLSGGRVAVLEKIHHALADGVGGVDIAVMILDTSPLFERRGPANRPLEGPSPVAILGSAALDAIREPIDIGHRLVSMGAHPLRTTTEVARIGAGTRSVLQHPLAPRCSLNANIAHDRRLRVLRMPFGTVHDTALALGGTVNDVLLTAVGAGLEALFAARHEDLGEEGIHVLVPVSVRGEDEHQTLDNKIAVMVVLLPPGSPDIGERFAATKAAVGAVRSQHQVDLVSALLAGAEHWPEQAVAAVAGLMHVQPFVNLVVTNVPGPPFPLYLMGSKLLEAYPIVPLARNLTVSIGMLSYDGHLTIGLWADRDRFADLDVLVDGLEEGFNALNKLARRGRARAK